MQGTGGIGFFTFGNVATVSFGGGDTILLFQVGLPREIAPFDAIVLGDYSNAANSDDWLVCPSGGSNGSDGSCSGAYAP